MSYTVCPTDLKKKIERLSMRPLQAESAYRSRATNGRSQLVAALLSLQAKMHFLCIFERG